MLFHDVVQNQNPWKQKVGNKKFFESPGLSASEHRLRYLNEVAARTYGANLSSSHVAAKLSPKKEVNSKDMVLTFGLQWWNLSVL